MNLTTRSQFGRTTRAAVRAALVCAIVMATLAPCAHALDPAHKISQYILRTWNQEDGLPQDTVRALAQTRDGALWLGTEEGLARFDGYEFTSFNRRSGALAANTILGLTVASDGTLWVATTAGLTSYKDGRFRTFGRAEGLPDTDILAVDAAHTEQRTDKVYVIAGDTLCVVENGRARVLESVPEVARRKARVVTVADDGAVWVVGFNGVFRVAGTHTTPMLGEGEIRGAVPSALLVEKDGGAWIGLSTRLLHRAANGAITAYTTHEGLPDNFVRAVLRDRNGALWVGTNGGLARLEGNRFVAANADRNAEHDWVRALAEDVEGNLWVGTTSGLSCYNEGRFTLYSRAEGLPGDKPTVVRETSRGEIWLGFHDRGLYRFRGGAPMRITVDQGLPSNEVFSIRERHDGSLLVATREGAAIVANGRARRLEIPDVLGRHAVWDVLEDNEERIWASSPSGVFRFDDGVAVHVAGGGPHPADSVLRMAQGADGTIWAVSMGNGLWRIHGGLVEHFTTKERLPADYLRTVHIGRDGTVWIGMFGDGLAWWRGGRFYHAGASEGLGGDTIASIAEDARGDLWLSTTRGIWRVRRASLEAFTAGSVRTVKARLFGVADGLRSAQCAPSYPGGGGSTVTRDGLLWFPTGQGLAALNPNVDAGPGYAPRLAIAPMEFDGEPVQDASRRQFGPGAGRLIFRFAGIYLRAPEAVNYRFRLDGVDTNWVAAGARRTAGYSNLAPGHYVFHVRASASGAAEERDLAFTILPHFYQTWWFAASLLALLGVMVWCAWQLRMRTLRSRFRLVLDERARLARELHDTLAQDFVGLATLLDAIAFGWRAEPDAAAHKLDLARRMVRHSLTEARRSVMDLRAAVLQGQSLSDALRSAAPMWVAGHALEMSAHVIGEPYAVAEETEQHLLRIAQEAVHNAARHAEARVVEVELDYSEETLALRIRDDGRGFDAERAFDPVGGHFGILGMRERAERIGGSLTLTSVEGQGTRVEVRIEKKTAERGVR